MTRNREAFSLGVKHQLFNNEVRKRRLEIGLTQRNLEAASGISGIGHIETFRKYPTLQEANKISEVLDSDIKTLFPNWIEELKDKTTSVVTEHLVTERILEHPELKSLPSPDDMQMVEDKIDMDMLKDNVGILLNSLNDREKKVIKERCGIGGERPKTLGDVGKEFGLTVERIRQIEQKAFRKLRHPSKRKYFNGYIDNKKKGGGSFYGTQNK